MIENGSPQLLTVKQVARRLSVGDSTAWRAVREGRLPSIKVGSCRRVLVSDLENFIRELRAPSGTPGRETDVDE